MKPTFALDLSRDVIALLHRTPKGWLTIGEVAFDAPDLAEELDYLRKTALGLSPLGLACKVILPNNQLLYTEIHAPGPSREDKRRQIAQALQGRTPYPVEDLVFDWSGKGSVVRVAVVARETLDEAEAFAAAHRLNPVSFVAIPEEDTFIGEAWFGPTNAADTFLAPGETVERDRDAVVILARDVAAVPTPQDPAPQSPQSLPGLEAALSAEVTEADLAAIAASSPASPSAEDFEPIDSLDDPTEDLVVEPKPEIPDSAPVEAEVETTPELPASVAEPETAPPPAFASGRSAPPPLPEAPEEAPFADVADEAEPPAPSAVKSPLDAGEARVLVSDILDDDLPPPPSEAAMFAFASRRAAPVDPRADKPGRVPPPVVSSRPSGPVPRPIPPSSPASAVVARPVAGPVTAPTIPGARPKPKPRVEFGEIARPVAPGGPVTVRPAPISKSPFAAPPPKRRRPGFIFMVMIGLLLLSLALVAAWASFFLTQSSSDPIIDTPTEVVEVPTIDEEMAADLQDPEDFATDTGEGIDPATTETEDLAALSVEEMPVNIGGDETGPEPATDIDATLAATADAAAEPGDPAAGSETELAGAEEGTGEAPPGTTIATNVTGSRTPVEDQDEIFLAAMDAPPPVLDALALTPPAETQDTPPAAPMPPPAFGTVYQFDPEGLLVPTAEGILSPDGIMLFAGPPPLVPPARSAVAEAAAAAAAPLPAPDTSTTTVADASLVTAGDAETAAPDSTTEAAVLTSPADPALAGFRPKARPDGLVVPDDGASLEDPALAEFATIRPLARPASVSAAADAIAGTEGTDDLGAQGASLAAQAEARLAEAAALEATNPSIVAISMRPMGRPSDLSRAVEDAVAAAVMEPDPNAGAEVELAAADSSSGSNGDTEIDEPETEGSAPAIPTKASVAKQATYESAINLSKTNLIGIFGTSSNPYALIRQSNGNYKKVEVGDRIDGGVIQAITENEVRYQKGGKLVTLALPKA